MREAMESEKDSTEEASKKLDVAAVEKPELVSSVQERLNNLNAITKEDEPAETEEEPEDSTPETKDGDDAVKDDDQAETEEKPEDSTPAKEKDSGSEEKISIPESYMRAAIHRGWKQDVIDELVESNPELAKKTLESLYLDVNNASKEWSALGRAARDAELEKQQSKNNAATETTDVDVAPIAEKLRKEYPDDPLIEANIKLLENTAKLANAKPQAPADQGRYQTATARANAAADASTDQRVNNFFGSDVMTPYDKFYGKLELGQSIEDLSSGQQQNRFAVLENAEYILAGHHMRSAQITVDEALEKAHLMVTEPIREQVIRDNLKATATKRAKSMTLRPSESKQSPKEPDGKAKNRKEFISKVEQKMASIPGLR